MDQRHSPLVAEQIGLSFHPNLRRFIKLASSLSPIQLMPTDIPEFDLLTGGGLPIGRLTRIFGPASCGKSTFLLAVIRSAQRSRGLSLIIDADSRFDPSALAPSGVVANRLIVSVPTYAEQAFELAETALAQPDIGLVAIDSVSGLSSLTETSASHFVTEIPTMMSRALPKLCRLAAIHGKLLLMSSQVRKNSDRGYRLTPTGGLALAHYQTLAIRLNQVETTPTSRLTLHVQATIMKSRTIAQEGTSAFFELFKR